MRVRIEHLPAEWAEHEETSLHHPSPEVRHLASLLVAHQRCLYAIGQQANEEHASLVAAGVFEPDPPQIPWEPAPRPRPGHKGLRAIPGGK